MITHDPFVNCVLGILQSYPNTYDWIYSNFINIYINKTNGADYFYPKFLWNVCPFLDTYTLPYIFVKKNFSCYTEFLEACLKERFYIYSILNMKYIRKYNKKADYDHNPIITNINSETKSVQMYDFFDNGIYELYDCPYSEINEAFRFLPECKGFNVENYLNDNSEIVLIKYNDQKEYRFNREDFNQNIRSYLNSDNLFKGCLAANFLENNSCECFCWGIECWDNIIQDFNLTRYFSLLVSHCKMWRYRYYYLVQKGYMHKSDSIEAVIYELDHTAKIIMNSYLRLLIRKEIIGKSNFEKFNSLINQCKSLEYTICEYFLSK